MLATALLLSACDAATKAQIEPVVKAALCKNSKSNHVALATLALTGGALAGTADTIGHDSLVAWCGPDSPEWVAPGAINPAR